MACSWCGATMANLGLIEDRVFHCPRCGSLKFIRAGIEEYASPALCDHAFLLAERVGLLLGCLRNYRDHGTQDVDLDGALRLEPEVARLLADVRECLPKPQ